MLYANLKDILIRRICDKHEINPERKTLGGVFRIGWRKKYFVRGEHSIYYAADGIVLTTPGCEISNARQAAFLSPGTYEITGEKAIRYRRTTFAEDP